MTVVLTVDQADRLLAGATLPQLLAAIRPHGPADGGGCPTCTADAWAVDQLVWTCTTGHRGTIYLARDAVAHDTDALARLAGAGRLVGPSLHPPVDHLPALVDPDGWATPADMLRRAVAAPLQPDEQTTWAREFARLHGADLLGRLLEPLDLPAGSGWLDVRTQLRRLQRGAA